MSKSFKFNDPTEPPEGRGREINGRRWPEAPGTRYLLLRYGYKKHLQEIKQNLEDGAGNYIGSMNDETIKGGVTRAAVFGLIRMIMPSIETIARAKGMGPTTLLFALDVPAPNLMWNLYRDMLIHNDEWVSAKLGDKTIRPMIMISISGTENINMHLVNPNSGTHTLNVGTLYYDLIKYLGEEIRKAPDDKMIDIINGIEYLESTNNEEVKLLIGEAKIAETIAQAREDWFIRHFERKLERKSRPDSTDSKESK